MKNVFVICMAILVLAGSVHAQKNDSPFEFQLKKVADDIYVAFREEPLRAPVEGNVTIIVNENDVVVVDASGTPEGGNNIIALIHFWFVILFVSTPGSYFHVVSFCFVRYSR